MGEWKDMPYVFDRPDWCPDCQGTTIHKIVAYNDSEGRTCTKCGRHATIYYEQSNQTGFNVEKPDRRTTYYNDKDKVERTYRDHVEYKKRRKRKKGGR